MSQFHLLTQYAKVVTVSSAVLTKKLPNLSNVTRLFWYICFSSTSVELSVMNYHNAKQTKSLRKKNTKGSFDIQSITALYDSDDWLISFSLSWSNQSILTRMVNFSFLSSNRCLGKKPAVRPRESSSNRSYVHVKWTATDCLTSFIFLKEYVFRFSHALKVKSFLLYRRESLWKEQWRLCTLLRQIWIELQLFLCPWFSAGKWSSKVQR